MDGAIRYACKYACKIYQKAVPREYRSVGRFWGASYDVKLPDVEEIPATEAQVREVLFWLGRNVSGFEVLPKIVFCKPNLPE